jgi:23S rRNA (uridine2552-2'-O)-methyltransferase
LPTYDRKDRYHQRAKREGFRSRAAYKLDQIQRAHRLLRAGQRVVDLGCWPGGWLQVAAAAVGPSGRVVGVDIAALDPPIENANVIAFQGDLSEPAVVAALLEKLGGQADVLLCDAAPKLTGIRDADRANEGALLEAVERALPELLRPGGDALIKILESSEAQAVDKRLRAGFERAKSVRPEASRPGTRERYLLAFGFRGSPKRGKPARADSP